MTQKLPILLSFLILFACSPKEFDPNDPAGSFAIAREPYDDKDYEMAIQRLGEYKARFPYSKFSVNAELFIANSQFELEQYDEAAASYIQFVKLHPKHEQIDFAMYRVGESYWEEAPTKIDRDQEFTAKAIEEWEKLVLRLPDSEYSKKAIKNIKEGQRRIAESMDFVANFYCKQEIYHACAYRYSQLAEKFSQFPDLKKKAYERAAKALLEVAEAKKEKPDSDKNLYHARLSVEEIISKAKQFQEEADKITEK